MTMCYIRAYVTTMCYIKSMCDDHVLHTRMCYNHVWTLMQIGRCREKKPDFVACTQQIHRSAWAFAQSDQCLYSLSRKNYS